MLKIFLCEPIHPRALALLKTRAEAVSYTHLAFSGSALAPVGTVPV